MAKKHDINMVAAWERENGVKGFEHLDPVNREKQRSFAQRRANEKNRESRYEGKRS